MTALERLMWDDLAELRITDPPDPPPLMKFDPHQPRDWHGRWTDVPGAGVADLPDLPEGFELAEAVDFPGGLDGPKTIQHAFNDNPDPARPGFTSLGMMHGDPTTHLVLSEGSEEWEPFENWIYDITPDDYVGYQDQVFNDDFWRGVDPTSGSLTLYHGTSAERAREIAGEGLIMGNITHGITNAYQGPAVYASRDRGYAMDYAYGQDDLGAVVEIDAGAMKRDGFTPFLHGEEPLMEANARDSVAWQLGEEDFHDESADYDGLSIETAVIRDDIPAKYLTVAR